jgi:hypothetical protein
MSEEHVVTVLPLSNGIPFHSWVIGLPYFHREPTPGQTDEELTEQTKPNVL